MEAMTVIEMIKTAYIKVMGEAKWESLTPEEKHDVIMQLAKDMNKALDKLYTEVQNDR